MYQQTDFLSERELRTFINNVDNNAVPWDLNPKEIENGHQYALSHTYWDSETGIEPVVNINTYWQVQQDFGNKIFPTAIVRAHIQVAIGRESKEFETGLITAKDHSSYLTAYLFLKTTDGYIEFEDETKVDAIENTLIVFEGSKKHRIVAATEDNPVMAVLGMDFIPSIRTPEEFFTTE